MNGSWIAENIERDLRREKYYKNKKRAKCIVDKQKQCRKCQYQNVCNDSVEINNLEEELK